MEFGLRRCNQRKQCAYIIKAKHTWSDTPAGLQLSTVQRYGLDMKLARESINPRVLNGFAGERGEPVKKCQRMVLHMIEEIGALQYWLPQAYEAAGGSM